MSISEFKPVSEPVRRIEVFTGQGRRRSWSDEDKAVIIAESHGGGESVCGVARRHGLTPQQLFTWRREARQAAAAVPAFVPAVIAPEPEEQPTLTTPRRRARGLSSRRRGAGIEVEAAGITVRIGDKASPAMIAAVIGALKGGA